MELMLMKNIIKAPKKIKNVSEVSERFNCDYINTYIP